MLSALLRQLFIVVSGRHLDRFGNKNLSIDYPYIKLGILTTRTSTESLTRIVGGFLRHKIFTFSPSLNHK